MAFVLNVGHFLDKVLFFPRIVCQSILDWCLVGNTVKCLGGIYDETITLGHIESGSPQNLQGNQLIFIDGLPFMSKYSSRSRIQTEQRTQIDTTVLNPVYPKR